MVSNNHTKIIKDEERGLRTWDILKTIWLVQILICRLIYVYVAFVESVREDNTPLLSIHLKHKGFWDWGEI